MARYPANPLPLAVVLQRENGECGGDKRALEGSHCYQKVVRPRRL